MSLSTQLSRRRRTTTLVVAAVGVVVGGALLVLAGGGSSGQASDVPPQPKPIERPGYIILSNCGGFMVTNEANALVYARQIAASAPGENWREYVDEVLFGSSCSLDAQAWTRHIKATPTFFYRMIRAVLQGAYDAGRLTSTQGDEGLAATREEFAAVGVDMKALTPVKLHT